MRFGISTLADYNLDCLYAIIGIKDGREIELPIVLDFNRNWGESTSKKDIDITQEDVSYIDVAWKTKEDDNFFKIKVKNISSIISQKLQHTCGSIDSIIIGINPEGRLTIWYEKLENRNLLVVAYATNSRYELQKDSSNGKIQSFHRKQFCQYCFRIIGLSQNHETTSISKIKLNSFDGSLNVFHESDTLNFNQLGLPYRISLDFTVDSFKYQSFIWLNFNGICSVYEKFYGAHPETKTDFIIRIDAENKKYELALYRQGLKEPIVIPESAYQLIVFKNKFEDYRSENYNQPQGAWIW